MADCRYLVAADEYATGVDLQVLKPASSERMLCVWAHYHPAAVEKLANTPPWLMKTALAADLWRKGQCARCPCFDAGPAVEQPQRAGAKR